jgi:AcrR family transcriptional regulator
MSPRSGRRPGGADTRAEILRAALRLFAERGYSDTTLREVGAAAAVDPALVVHYFASKERLFAQALQIPLEPDLVLRALQGGDPSQAGARVIRLFLSLWESPPTQEPLMAMLRSALTNAKARDLLRSFLGEAMVGPVAAALGGTAPELRATLVGSQLVGLAVARYMVPVEPLASADPDLVTGWIAPTLQRYLAGGPASPPGAGQGGRAGSPSKAE